MSIVGPRPLSVLHYERDKAQGNVTRSLLKVDYWVWGILIRVQLKWATLSMSMSMLSNTLNAHPLVYCAWIYGLFGKVLL